MKDNCRIHWCEGLFLQPHHLQYMQKGTLDALHEQNQLNTSYPYGVLDMALSEDDLEDMRVKLTRLCAVMPSGLVVNYPRDSELSSLDIKEALNNTNRPLTVSLSVPLWNANQPNLVEDNLQGANIKRLYKIAEINRNDENIGANPTKILVRKTNARLTLSHEDTSDMESVPILQIIPSAGENLGRPKMAPDYIPPCYSLSGSAVLRELLMGIASQVQTSRNELVPQINHGGFSFDHIRGTQFEQIFRLQTLNRYAAVLNPLVKAPNGVSPFQMYLLLRQLQAELAALSPEADPFETIDYDHDNLTLVFNNLAEKIKDLLKSSVKSNYLKIDFTYSDQFKAHLAEIKEEHLTRSNEYFLAIETKEDPQVLVPYVMDRDKFKLMPKSLMNQRIFGVSLEYEQHFPVELPSTPGRYYFRLNRSESQRIWGRIEQEKGLAVKWPSVETVDYKLKLFMTIS